MKAGKILTVLCFFVFAVSGHAQTQFKVIDKFYTGLPKTLTAQIVSSLDKLLRCGQGDENYFKSIGNLAGINRANFNEKVYKLLF